LALLDTYLYIVTSVNSRYVNFHQACFRLASRCFKGEYSQLLPNSNAVSRLPSIREMDEVSQIDCPDRPIPSALALARALLRFCRHSILRIKLRGKLRLGIQSFIGPSATLHCPEFLHIGNRVGIGPRFLLQTNLEIGDDTLISADVAFVGNDHAFGDPKRTVFTNGRLGPNTIIMEGDNLIGYGVTIIGSVRIGKGCIVGARSVVTKDLPPYTVCVGSPARPIRPRFANAR